MADVELRDLTVDLGDPPQRVIDSVSLHCPPGTLTLVLGANGSGKSVLLRTILALVSATSGSVMLNGTDLRRKPRLLHAVTGVCFQNPDLQIFGDTVADDVALALNTGHRSPGRGTGDPAKIPARSSQEDSARRHQAQEQQAQEQQGGRLIAEFGLAGREDEPPWNLSGGQRRRLALAGALAGQPEVLILDEPFLELDYPSVEQLVRSLRAFRNAGGTVILASHETRDIWPEVDQTLVMYRGQALYSGPPEGALPYITPEYGLRPLPQEQA
ncbi:MAG: ABC transporter ATP-binding protein [Alkalispirochaeta sp.]